MFPARLCHNRFPRSAIFKQFIKRNFSNIPPQSIEDEKHLQSTSTKSSPMTESQYLKSLNIEEPFHPDLWRYPDPSQDKGDHMIAPDYPRFETFDSYQTRSPYQKWDDPQMRRNFGEALPEHYDILSVQCFDVETSYSLRYMLLAVTCFFGSMFGIIQIINAIDDPKWRTLAVRKDGIIGF